MTQCPITFALDTKGLNIKVNNIDLCCIKQRGGLFWSPEYLFKKPSLGKPKIVGVDNTILWHFRLGHPSKECAKLTKQLTSVNSFCEDLCTSCARGKLTNAKIPSKALNRRGVATSQLERIHLDLVGPFPILSYIDGYKYFVLVTDEYSYYRWLIPL